MKMRSGPKVSGRSRRVAADQGWSLRGVPLYFSDVESDSFSEVIEQVDNTPLGKCYYSATSLRNFKDVSVPYRYTLDPH